MKSTVFQLGSLLSLALGVLGQKCSVKFSLTGASTTCQGRVVENNCQLSSIDACSPQNAILLQDIAAVLATLDTQCNSNLPLAGPLSYTVQCDTPSATTMAPTTATLSPSPSPSPSPIKEVCGMKEAQFDASYPNGSVDGCKVCHREGTAQKAKADRCQRDLTAANRRGDSAAAEAYAQELKKLRTQCTSSHVKQNEMRSAITPASKIRQCPEPKYCPAPARLIN